MKLYADSGSTKTEWILTEKDKIINQFTTIGMNPLFIKENEIYSELDKNFVNHYFKDVKELHFFGAGCSDIKQANKLSSILGKLFNNAQITIKTDIELAVLAVSTKKEKSIVSILGTGSTFRIFDGNKTIKNYSSLGFIIGDEGSGTHIGKSLLRKIFYNQINTEIYFYFFDDYDLQVETLIENVYSKPFPNKYLASFTHFCKKYIDSESIEEIVIDSFYSYFKNHILNVEDYQEHTLHFVGSVAFHFKEQLEEVAAEFDCEIGTIIQKPLALYLANLKNNYLP